MFVNIGGLLNPKDDYLELLFDVMGGLFLPLIINYNIYNKITITYHFSTKLINILFTESNQISLINSIKHGLIKYAPLFSSSFPQVKYLVQLHGIKAYRSRNKIKTCNTTLFT